MPKKRRNNGRSKNNRGKTRAVPCYNCIRFVPKDKAIKKFTVKDLIEAASKEDLKSQSIYKDFEFPKVYNKLYYCVSCAVHARIVRVRSTADKRLRHFKKLDKPLALKKVKAN